MRQYFDFKNHMGGLPLAEVLEFISVWGNLPQVEPFGEVFQNGRFAGYYASEVLAVLLHMEPALYVEFNSEVLQRTLDILNDDARERVQKEIAGLT